jgi:hypothetical protein
MFHRFIHASRLLTAAALVGSAAAASAGTFTDTGDSGGFFGTPDNMSIYNSKFEVTYDEFAYDGDGGTFEDDKALGSITYDVSNGDLGLPAGDIFTQVSFDAYAWSGRSQFDGQTLDDIFAVEVSDDGINFAPVSLSFSGNWPTTENFTATAAGLSAQFVRVSLLARVESAGVQDQNVWSSQIFDITLTSAPIPEPGSLMLLGPGAALLAFRRRHTG